MPTKLLRQVGLRKLIGYTTTEMAAGFCQRGKLAAGPMHKNTLADAVERLTAEELEQRLKRDGEPSGQDLWVLKHRLGIDFVVPSKDNMRVNEDA